MSLTRRDLLAGMSSLGAINPLTKSQSREKPFRIAFISDIHIQAEFRAFDLTLKALRKVKAEKPDAIIFGGDLVMNASDSTEETVARQWELFNRAVSESNFNVPTHFLLGESDLWGINKAKSKTTGTEKQWGKSWFLSNFNYQRTCQELDLGGWHWFLLDTIQIQENGFRASLDADQVAWLEVSLKRLRKDKPVAIASHIPLIAPSNLIRPVATVQQIQDFEVVRDLIGNHSNVKVCIAGHTHLVDRYDYNNVTFIGAGAVSGNWWQGRYREFEPSFTLLDLWEDGKWDHKNVIWGWSSE